MAIQRMSDGDLTVEVAHSGNTAYGRARYVVVVRKAGQSTALFESAALELPWRDDRRALIDACRFLAHYAAAGEDDVPDAGAGVTTAQVVALAPYADTLALFESELLGE